MRAVAVLKDGHLAGHAPYNLATRLSQLKREVSKATGSRVNRGTGYGLEVSLYIPSIQTTNIYPVDERDYGLI